LVFSVQLQPMKWKWYKMPADDVCRSARTSGNQATCVPIARLPACLVQVMSADYRDIWTTTFLWWLFGI
jgi:hypothetical protein